MNSLFIYFLTASIVSSFVILLILLVKKGLKKHISARWHYNIDYFFLVLLAIPFVPRGFLPSLILPFNLDNWLNISHENGQAANTSSAITVGAEVGLADGLGWLQDFGIQTASAVSDYLLLIAMGVWLIGIIAFIVVMYLCGKNLRLIKESVKPIKDQQLLALFSHCKGITGVKSHIFLGTSILVKVPMTIGFFKIFIILPEPKISLNDVRYVLLHELTHCKNKDIQVNNIMCLFQILYWFNPLIYIAFKQMRLDRELACDTAVLKMLPKKHRVDYGTTLLNFVKAISCPAELFLTAGVGGSKPQIIKRIAHIASYTSESALLKVKSICVFAFIGILAFCQLPLISALAGTDDNIFYFRAGNVIYKDLSSFFGELEGSFVLYDLESGLYTVHNREMSVTRVSPLSTYKIVSALIALETGVLEADDTLREWDGTIQPFETWNQDQNLASAMQNSTSWYFQDMDIQVGKEALQNYLSRLSYGNYNISGGITDFWIDSSLRISPVEHVMVLKDVFQEDSIFATRHIETLKDALRLAERNGAVLSGKTGTGFANGFVNGSITTGWFIGYVENDSNTYIFATYIKGDDNAGGSAAAQITLSILENKGIY